MSTGIVESLRALEENKDGRGIVEMRESEPHYDVVVTHAIPSADGEATHVTFEGGVGCTLEGQVQVGDRVTIWAGNKCLFLGVQRHGWALNGEVVEWLTPWERVARRVQWLAGYDRRPVSKRQRRKRLHPRPRRARRPNR